MSTITKDLIVGDEVSYYRVIAEKHIGDFSIVNITYKYDENTGEKYPIYHIDVKDKMIKCDSRTGEVIGNNMWYFCNK